MAPQLSYYIENAESVGSGTSSFNMTGGGRASALLYLAGTNYPNNNDQVLLTDVIASISQILGSVSTPATNGRITRTLPLAHPLFPWLYASDVAVRGFGQGYKASGQQQLEAQPFPFLTGYPNYEFNVQFTPRPYVVAANASVPILPAVFFDATTVPGGTALPITANYAAEWVRYTNWWYDRKFESITARQGQMRFRISSGGAVANVPMSDMPRLFLPDSVLHVVWQQVPYRYITSPNSYVDGLIGYINQNKFTTWNPGELLYIGYNAKPYTPPVQTLDSQYTGTTGYIFSTEKLVDLELLFLRTKRKIGAAGELYNNPTAGTVGAPYWIQAGWNLLPNMADRLYHYVTTVDLSNTADNDKTQWHPLFSSAEFALLFTDPDAPGAYQLNFPT